MACGGEEEDRGGDVVTDRGRDAVAVRSWRQLLQQRQCCSGAVTKAPLVTGNHGVPALPAKVLSPGRACWGLLALPSELEALASACAGGPLSL